MVKRLLPLLTLGLALLALAPARAEVRVVPDRDPVRLDESFQVVFESDEEVTDSPDFSPLRQDFQVIGRSQSSNVQIVNGQVSRRSAWTLTLLAARAGRLTIPPIAVGRGHSPALPITVLPAGAPRTVGGQEPDLILEVTAEPRSPYVQAQVLYTVRVFHAVELAGAELSEPDTGGAAVVQRVDEDHRFQSFRSGRRYQVVERRYALFPQRSGTLTIPPLGLRAQVVQGGAPSAGLFGLLDRQMTTRQVRSEPVTLEVQPQPADWGNAPWLPAAAVTLTEQWGSDPPLFRVGEPVTRTLVLNAVGLTAAQLPELSPPLPDGLKTYPEQPALSDNHGDGGLTGIRQESVALVPARAGRLTLPAVAIPWWNTTTGRREVASLPERSVEVLPATGDAAAPAPAAAAPQPAEPPLAAAAPAPVAAVPVTNPGIWPWVSLLLAVGWAATAALAWRRRPRLAVAVAVQPAAPAVGTALRALRSACRANDPAAARATLLDWARARWPAQPPRGLHEMAGRLSPELADELACLDRCRYGHPPRAWDGARLGQLCTLLEDSTDASSQASAALPTLYPT